MVRAAALIAIASLLSPAVRAEECDSWTPTVAASRPLGKVIAEAAALHLKRGEYETSAAFAQRSGQAGATFTEGLTIAWTQADLTKYDPDSETVIVDRYAVSSTCFLHFYSLPTELKSISIGPEPRYEFQHRDNAYCLTKSVSSVPGKAFIGENAYGARRAVSTFRDREEGIFLGVGVLGTEFFPAKNYYSAQSSPWFSVHADAVEAKSLATHAVILMKVVPLPPFALLSSRGIAPTIDAPVSVTVQQSYLVASVRCIALADSATGKVFAKRPFLVGEFGKAQ